MRKMVLLLCACVLASCGYATDEEKLARRLSRYDLPAGVTPPLFGTASVLIRADEGSVLVTADVAETDAQRQFGLMHRTKLDEREGMLFVYFDETNTGFWMKDTPLPLSVAFFDIDGRITDILDMEPCTEDPCETYEPSRPYMGALEVNQGSFDEWGVEIGDTIQITR